MTLHRVLAFPLLGVATIFLNIASAAAREPPPPGFKRIEAALQIQGLGRFSGYRFFIFPAHHEGGALPVESTTPFTYDQSTGGVLYAIKDDTPPPRDIDRAFLDRHPEVLRGDPVRMRELVPVADPADRMVTVFRVDSISGGRIHMHYVRDIKYRAGELIAAKNPSSPPRAHAKPDRAHPAVPPANPLLSKWWLVSLPLSLLFFVALVFWRKRR